MARETVEIDRTVPVKPEALWQVLRSFDISWHPVVKKCQLLRGPNGAVQRHFSDTDGYDYLEQQIYFSDTEKTLSYVLLSGIEALNSYQATVSVTPEDAGSRIRWTAEIHAARSRIDAIAKGTQAIFELAVETLAKPGRKPRRPADKAVNAANLSRKVIPASPKLSVLAAPSEHTGQAPLVLFLHGIGGQASNWTAQLQHLGSDYNVAALDLRGYGNSELNGNTTIDDYCADILRVADHYGTDKLVLAGLSYGAWIATSFAMRHGSRLLALVLAGGCTGMSEAAADERQRFLETREAPLAAGKQPADFADAVVNVIGGPHISAEQRELLLQSMQSIPAATYRDALQCFCNPVETFDFSRIQCPVMLITGEHDQLAGKAEIRKVSQRMLQAPMAGATYPDIRFEVIPAAGHVCNVEQPDRVNELLSEFLARVPNLAYHFKLNTLEKQREKKARVLTAAHEEFCSNGYDGASMERVAIQAQVSKPTVYQYFGDKDGLFAAVLNEGRNHLIAPLSGSTGTLVDRLWHFSWVYADFVLSEDMLSLARLILGEASRRPDVAINYHHSGPARAFNGLLEFVQECQERDELNSDDADLIANDLWSLILSGPRDYYLHHATERPEQQELLRAIGHGLRVFIKVYSTSVDADLKALQHKIQQFEQQPRQGETCLQKANASSQ
jgi:pimeloyl-ACP methyl ester carboxylesterase